MQQNLITSKTCPACGSSDYTFRSRKKITASPEQNEIEAVETKYRCKACSQDWSVRVPVKGTA